MIRDKEHYPDSFGAEEYHANDSIQSQYCPKCGAGPWGNHLGIPGTPSQCPNEGQKPPFDWR